MCTFGDAGRTDHSDAIMLREGFENRRHGVFALDLDAVGDGFEQLRRGFL